MSGTNHSVDWSNKMAQASGGTLFIHEVSALPLELQLHLLRDLQFRDYEASSGHVAQTSEARLIMSTSENLTSLIDQGRFRQELYHRISVISLMLPPLRHRGTDVELLAESFRNHYAREFHKSVDRLHPRCARGSCRSTTGPATSASSRPRFSEPSRFATARGSRPTTWRRS